MEKRGAFIVIEGLDRSGKSTQASLLCSRLKNSNKAAHLLKFPDRTTPIGKTIDSYLRSQSDLDDRAIHLLFSANRWELVPVINLLLESRVIVVCDRYAFSGIAFSAAKPSLTDEFISTDDALTWCRAPDISLPAPDLTIFLDITPDEARLRGGYGEERYEKEEMQKRVKEVFYQLGEEMGSEAVEGDSDRSRWVVVDAGRDEDVVHEDLWELVQPLMKGLDGPVGRLWEDKLGGA